MENEFDAVRKELKAKRWDFDSLLALARVLPLIECRTFRYRNHGALHYDITYRGGSVQSNHFKNYMAE